MKLNINFSLLFCLIFFASCQIDQGKDKTSQSPINNKSSNAPNIILIYTDDMGYADLSCQGIVKDVKTPNIDQLAKEGVRITNGYVTAPQCVPSRAGFLTGKYQARFGLEHNPQGPLPLQEKTIGNIMQDAGYATGMIGKWHLDPNFQCEDWIKETLTNPTFDAQKRAIIPMAASAPYQPENRGFKDVMRGTMTTVFSTYDLTGKTVAPARSIAYNNHFRIDLQSEAAVSFINRNKEDPFFLYLAYFAPHVPLEAPKKYLDRFPGEMPERRRIALAMISAMDDGVGQIMETLEKNGLRENTLIFFISDNGAPLKIDKKDLPLTVKGAAWDGSLNDPWIGEKGTLLEGGIRVPFIANWKGTLPKGKVYDQPVLALDAVATAAKLAGQSIRGMNGVSLLPFLKGKNKKAPHKYLFWRRSAQEAVRHGKWKLLKLSDGRDFLFDLESKEHETKNLIEEFPKVGRKLNLALDNWSKQLKNPRMQSADLGGEEKIWFDYYIQEKNGILD